MWILYTHLAFSLICFVTCLASKLLVSPEKKEYIKLSRPKREKFATVKLFILCLIPIVNVATAIITFYMAACPLDKYIELDKTSKASQSKDKEILEQYKKEIA